MPDNLLHGDRQRPRSGDVVIWDGEGEPTPVRYWVRTQGRGSATHLFEGPDAWSKARSAAEALAHPGSTIWQRHNDGRFEKIAVQPDRAREPRS